MLDYQPPFDDIAFLLRHLVDLDRIASLPHYAEHQLTEEMALAILTEAGKVAAGVLAPLNIAGDREGAVLEGDRVRLPAGFQQAQRTLAEGGWFGVSLPKAAGGQALPELFEMIAAEFWNSANMAFALNPTLAAGAARAIATHGDDSLVNTWARPIAEGRWGGTMNLTEPQAGSDLGPIATTARPEGDHYRLRGQKIYITWGEHELVENIVHLVLARLPDGPPGTRGLSLFVVPKFLPDAQGAPGERNDVRCLSLEHKMGIHASPTCVMAYGENDGAIGYLLGKPHRGLACMFTMMNEARLRIGMQGVGVAERARQQSLAHARERIQGGVAIVEHPDVARMLMTQRALTEAMRAMACVEAANLDLMHQEDTRDRVALMTPVIKGWFTEVGQEVANLNIQVHGGMGYIEETGAGQLWRDLRIAAIYEGTNGIQAADLVSRKLLRDRGAAMEALHTEIEETVASARRQGLVAESQALTAGLHAHRPATARLLNQDGDAALADSFDYMMATGYLCGGWQMLRSLCAVQGSDGVFERNKAATARFYLDRILPRAGWHSSQAAADPAAWTAMLREGN